MPFLGEVCKTEEQRKRVAILKPLIYDIGWVITDRIGNIVKKENYLVQETFFVPAIFDTAYYKEKRPIYMELLEKGEISVGLWNEISDILLEDLRKVDVATAYNAAFDFKKAIPFTEKYINSLYSSHYQTWENKQRYQCRNIATGYTKENTSPDFLEPVFKFRGEEFPIADLWMVTCEKLGCRYKDFCLQNKLLTKSAQYFQTNAEVMFQYLTKNRDFIEDHTALSDALIEAEILTKALKRGAIKPQMSAFPFQLLGTTIDYVMEKRPRYAQVVLDALMDYISESGGTSGYWTKMEKLMDKLAVFIAENDL